MAVSDLSLNAAASADGAVGGVFVETNDPSANAVVAFARRADGSLVQRHAYSTSGTGTGGTVDPLASQFALVLAPSHQFLFAVNAGSNSIASFTVLKGDLEAIGAVPSGGMRPVSLAATNHVLYALNSTSNTVTGFRIENDGTLTPVPTWTRTLSAGASGAAVVRFSHDGHLLAVAERTSRTLDVFVVNNDGSLSDVPTTTTSNGLVPFGFDFTPRGQLLVSEAGSNAASSYDAARDGSLTLVSGSVATGPASAPQRAPCWLIVTQDGRFGYTANAGSGSVTGYAIAANGALSLVTPSGLTGNVGTGSTPLDLDVSHDGRFLYVLEAGTGTIASFAIAGDGSLSSLAHTAAVSPRSGQMGLAAY
jgi:6-phosphogluconolactonase (cycloisomerase 2 family)